MDDHSTVEENGGESIDPSSSNALEIYPLSCYYFGSRDCVPLKSETAADRLLRMKANYDAHGMRNCVGAVVVVELFKHPHVLLLQVRNSIYRLPGGRLRPGESDIECLKRKLSSKLSAGEDGRGPEWEVLVNAVKRFEYQLLTCVMLHIQVGECLGMWWRPDFESLLYPYLPPNIKRPKECTKLYLVKLPPSRRFIVPKNFRLLAIPLCQLHNNDETYGPIVSGVPQLLSKFSFNFIEP